MRGWGNGGKRNPIFAMLMSLIQHCRPCHPYDFVILHLPLHHLIIVVQDKCFPTSNSLVMDSTPFLFLVVIFLKLTMWSCLACTYVMIRIHLFLSGRLIPSCMYECSKTLCLSLCRLLVQWFWLWHFLLFMANGQWLCARFACHQYGLLVYYESLRIFFFNTWLTKVLDVII